MSNRYQHVLLRVRACTHASLFMCVRVLRISCGSDMGFECDRQACEHASLCGAGCSSTADAQWFSCVRVSVCPCVAT